MQNQGNLQRKERLGNLGGEIVAGPILSVPVSKMAREDGTSGS